jgi:hypothetical protein
MLTSGKKMGRSAPGPGSLPGLTGQSRTRLKWIPRSSRGMTDYTAGEKPGRSGPFLHSPGSLSFFAREQCLGRKEARPALRKMSLMDNESRREARAMGNEWRAERALGNRLGSEQKRPSFDAFSWARKKRHSGVQGAKRPCPFVSCKKGVRGRSAPPRSSEHLGVQGGVPRIERDRVPD